MHARVTTVAGSPEAAEQGIANFRENVLPMIRETGGRGAILLIDRETGQGVAITLWPDEETMRASEERANELRREAAQQMGATAQEPRVDRYEVAVLEV
jgi:quinol monooxygenase YgiN